MNRFVSALHRQRPGSRAVRMAVIVGSLLALSAIVVCWAWTLRAANTADSYAATESARSGFRDPSTKLRAARIISSFENSTTELQYGYAEQLDDGRGITAGVAGFTSGTGDMLQVIERYTELVPTNALAEYLPALRTVSGGSSVAGLGGLTDAWMVAAGDEQFRQAQDDIANRLYYWPAMKFADQQGIRSAVGRLILWDTIVQHGDGADPDGLPALIARTTVRYPHDRGIETLWLRDFLEVRRSTLLHAADPATREAWRGSVDRVNALESLLANSDLTPPLRWSVYGDSYILNN